MINEACARRERYILSEAAITHRVARMKKIELLTLLLLAAGSVQPAPAFTHPAVAAVLEAEQDLGASIGFFLHDLQTGDVSTHNADIRFPLNSTFKLFACAALLSRAEEGLSDLSESIELGDVLVQTWSPGVESLLGAGRSSASLDELCRMMLEVSDNTAANLVLSEIGGPDGFTEFMRSIGDDATRLDRWEPALNEGLPGDPRDTTTPRAIARSLQKLLLGQTLQKSSRETLRSWLAGHSVADDLLRTALPDTWRIEDRTGAGGYGTRGIVAVLYPPGRDPIVTTLYMRDANVSIDERNTAIARVGRVIVQSVEPD